MKKILLCCSAGMSTSSLVKKMKEAARTINMECEIEAKGIAEAKQELDKWDIVMIGPQVSYTLNELKSMTSIPVEVIPANIYALAKGKEALDMARRMLGINN
ncbi:PTS sugar transporter subunit IIB [Spiroplasma endosymbiont of Labia minor]|uniref:PTS sugar transporter subunit IIB n=1 Tax=Spiroplasma endosymbiont of Labia minor TaxID=3066305 RepID=UPI0030CA8A7F